MLPSLLAVQGRDTSGGRDMRTVYRVLAWIIAVEVLLQAAAITYAVFGLGKWIQEGGVFDKAVIESEGATAISRRLSASSCTASTDPSS